MVAPVHRGDEAAGIVVVDARAGSVDRLTRADVDMVEMMTKQIGMALERGYLERSLHQLVELERQLTQQAFYDSVTGLVNRNYLMRELAALCTDQHGSHAVLLVDLDDFKMVNDSLGHVAGDELLKIVAQRLVGSIGDRGVVGRLGGDEFAIVLRNTDDEFCNRTAQHIISALAQVAHLEGREVSVGGSVGVRRTTGPPDEPATILRDADLALYDAKAMGKGRVAHFEPAMHELAQERLALTSALALAIEREEFVLVYQPIFDMVNRRVSAAEALVRWMHPERGQLGPASFLQLCEESGWIVEIGWCVLREALQQLADWEPMLAGTEFYLSVNVSARQLREPHFAEDVLALLRTYNVPGHRLVLEITESLFIDDPIQTQQVLERMATAGLRFGLDDFGTGYSSLSQLQRLPLYLVKIDQSFVARLGTGTEATVFVRAIIQLADALRLQVVAEGVETVGQADELVRLGCRRGQGWLYARATSARELTAILDARAGQLAHEA
ncbi:MAG: bifunctional diguanylate cyclase/phosphodiesterase [Ilumatobacteraceae bacterium]